MIGTTSSQHPRTIIGDSKERVEVSNCFAIQSQIVSLLTYRGQRIFRASTGHYYTPHSGRNFMPSATAVLGFSKSDRDVLGGWSAEGSERYSRAAKYKITNMQTAVSQSFTSADLDPLGEADDIDALGNFLKSWEVPDKEILRVKTLLVSRTSRTCSVMIQWKHRVTRSNSIDSGDLAPDNDLDEELSIKEEGFQREATSLEPRPLGFAGDGPQANQEYASSPT